MSTPDVPFVSLGSRGRHGHSAFRQPNESGTAALHDAAVEHRHPGVVHGNDPMDITHLDVQFDPDDPSDAVLAVTLEVAGEEHVVEYPLTEVKAARLRAGLATQADAVRHARHSMAGEPLSTDPHVEMDEWRETPDEYSVDDFTQDDLTEHASDDSDYPDDMVDDAPADEHTATRSRRARDVGRVLADPLSLDTWATNSMSGADSSGRLIFGFPPSRAVMYGIVGMFLLVFVIVILGNTF